MDIWAHVAAERRTMADLLGSLSPSDWATPSLCADWTVQEVAAHVAWGPTEPAREKLAGLARHGFRVNRANTASARRWGARGSAAIIERLHEIAEDRRRSLGITDAHVLADIICHDLDIRRPLGRTRPMPPEPFRLTADLMVRVGWPLDVVFARSPRKTVAGLRLVADDLDWAHGSGPEVHGTAEALLLAIIARPVGRNELTGHGAPVLRERLA